MKVYVDTGVFIDYLSPQALGGATLRSAPRRGRPPAQLYNDAAATLKRISDHHQGATSCLTYYEVEEALHKQWESEAKGLAHASTLRVLAARSIMPQTAMAIRFFQLQALELTPAIVAEQLNHPVLHIAGVRAADALHVATAILFGADLLVSADDDILQLDQQISNCLGAKIRCVDTDVALMLL
jgi:predicted nucleic acid-binding protein